MRHSKNAFTLIEVLVASVILTIGFSALYYWFLAHGTMARQDRLRAELLRHTRNIAEWTLSQDTLPLDSNWQLDMGSDTLIFRLQSWDSLGANAPVEVLLEASVLGKSVPVKQQLYYLVGGVYHERP